MEIKNRDFIKKCISKKAKDKTYKLWTAKKFITATELENFLNELKPKVIGKPIKKISIVGNLFDYEDISHITEFNGKYYCGAEWCGTDEEGMEILDYNSTCEIEPFEIHIPDGTVDEYVAELDEPAIIQIGEDIQFEVHFQEENLVQIGINTLKEGEFMSDINYSYEWRDISGYYAKNTIGHTIKDVYINKTDSASISWQIERKNGDDMYDEIGFILDNGYKLKIYGFADYMELAETAPEK